VQKPDIQQVYQAGSFLLCIILAMQIESGLEGEFRGGWLTGPLLSMEDIGTALFMVALAMTFVFPRVAAAIGCASSVLCLPLYVFLIAPVPFAAIFASGHQFKVRQTSGIHWHRWPVTGLLVLAVTFYVCIRRVVAIRKQISQRP
jgi:hypothetical protein